MSAATQTSTIAHVVRFLPGPLLRALDSWSQRVARRRWEQRQQKWRQDRAASQAADALTYRPKSPRD